MADILKGIAKRPFSGMTRRGSRFEYLINELWERGCRPSIDNHGNVWVEKGSGKKIVLFSSHIDVDRSVRDMSFRYLDGKRGKEGKRGKSAIGVLDNSAGCYINLLLAQQGPKKGKAIYVFTASEEVFRGKPRKYCQSAREVVRELRKRGIKPALCVAIDVTHPKLRKKQEKMDWDGKEHELFDLNDKTHCYIDGYSRRDARKLGISLVRSFGDSKIGARRFSGEDEAHVYSKLCPSFAFGPVVFGRFDRPKQEMPLAHLRTAIRFLRWMRV